MERCLKCKRFGVKYDPSMDEERCFWKDCLWVNLDEIDLSQHDYGVNFKEFRDAITKKIFK